ncbi:hypothetical protein OQA88_1038 [Cercophora sp. LCS_1]
MATTSATQGSMLMYGTAYKKERTGELTKEALIAGFRAIDTANYPTAYNEPLTGDGIQAAIKSSIKREDLFIQTKFPPLWAHDKDKIPFNPDQDMEAQVWESIEQSFEHLKVDYIDALLLHAPFENENDNIKAWKVFETFVPHRIRRLGVSNFALPQLVKVYEAATVKPEIVQNHFYKETSFDPGVMASELIALVAERLNIEKELAFYLLILGLGGTQVLCGTTNSVRMGQNLKAVGDFESNQAVRDKLQPSIEAFKRMLEKLGQDTEGSKI